MDDKGIGSTSREAGTIWESALQLPVDIQSSPHLPANHSCILTLFYAPPPTILKDSGSIVLGESKVLVETLGHGGIDLPYVTIMPVPPVKTQSSKLW